ncbi:UDP-N-acetylmuramoyl-L-alanine--D-glutamate ligase [bacterium]|nr:UDP-N-acetylmuramoyl-L-alanine--D-glutamate ligase [bacterium]
MFTNKKVLIFGLGLNDGGLGMTEYFLEQGAKVTITDGKSEEELKEPLKRLSTYPNITYHLGGHLESDFVENDIIVRNPAIKPNNKYLKIARDAGKEIVTQMALFHKLSPTPIVGITGTKGKSTTTTLIYELFKSKYEEKVLLGGNIGKSAIRELPGLNKNNISVLELSSFQLDGMGESRVSPHIAVITNIFSDHLDWHGSMEEYIEAKKNIFLHQGSDDYLVLNIDDDATVRAFVNEAKGKVITISMKDSDASYYMDENLRVFENGNILLQLEDLILEGEHNFYNILCAIAVVRIYDLSVEKIVSVVQSFRGVSHRQEFVRDFKGVKYYNDTCATAVQSVIAMFDRFGEGNKGKIVMIAGGIDKGMDYSKIAPYMENYLKSLILFEGSASEKISKYVSDDIPVEKYFDSMGSAIEKARELASDGDMVILCPGGSSFNMFINEFDRGNQFIEYVNSLK